MSKKPTYRELEQRIFELEKIVSTSAHSAESKEAEIKVEYISLMQQSINSFMLDQTLINNYEELIKSIVVQIDQLLRPVFTVFNTFNQETHILKVQEIKANHNILNLAVKIGGERILSTRTKVDAEMYEDIASKRLKVISTLYEATGGTISKPISLALAKAMKIKCFLGFSYLVDNLLSATTLIALKEKPDAFTMHLLQNYTYFTSLSIKRVLTESSLKQSEAKFRAIVKNASPVVFTINKEGTFLLSEGKSLKALGLKPGQVVGMSAFEIYKDYPAITKGIKDALAGRISRDVVQVGNIFFDVLFSPNIDDSGNINSILGMAIDITERKQAEKELQKAKNYISNIIDSMPSVLISVDDNGVVTQWNNEAENKTDFTSKEAIDQPLALLIPRLDCILKNIEEAMESGRVHSFTRQAYYNKDGEKQYEDITIYPLISDDAKGAVIRIDDVTEQVRVEEMLVQSEKLLSVGGLAAGMAHEINNPLGGIIQSAAVLRRRLTDSKMPANKRAAEEFDISIKKIISYLEARDVFKLLDRIDESGMRAAGIVSNMLSFTRKSDISHSPHYLDELLDKSIELAESDYNLMKKYDFRQIEIFREYDENLPAVPCQSGEVQQVFLNILRNGAEAMLDHMTEDSEKKAQFTLRIVLEKEIVRIEIEDKGPGMDENTRKRIFEPFFTTKQTGQGTGLGLSISYFIITEHHGGEMSVMSTPGEGSTFIICLPLKGK
ncbi:PAS domain S-box protein [Spirochaeta isovalerica]|uniref:histidine kinase n=1 Tax=Spirochaeta isovalerica TaxID=150 RepID=A0A841RGG5_9SPIO|nr:PAS domain S-box protein [Spirochaeta isovalerica]MBB6482481.1 PAS domain S-box-containing protein [Spirochaeta isovalerica]